MTAFAGPRIAIRPSARITRPAATLVAPSPRRRLRGLFGSFDQLGAEYADALLFRRG